MAEDLEARFKKAVWLVRNGPKMESSNDTKLAFYKYFKQVIAKGILRKVHLEAVDRALTDKALCALFLA